LPVDFSSVSIKENIFFISSLDWELSVTITREGLFEDALTNPQEPFSKVNLIPLTVKISLIFLLTIFFYQ
tara:strand:- start:31 stop:240 length:210 start_codon:yes stop_codon:yes gene_type:complete